MLGESDWDSIDKLQIDLSYTKKALNGFDESALEIALHLFDDSEGCNNLAKLTALSVGGGSIENYSKMLYALKYDNVVQIHFEDDLTFNSTGTAQLIAAYYQKYGGQQAILMGRQSSPGDNAETPLRVAEILGLPCITGVLNLERTNQEDVLEVKRQADGGTITQMIKLPAVFQIGDSPITHLRVPTLKDKMKTKHKKTVVLTAEDLNQDKRFIQNMSDLELISFIREKEERMTQMIKGKNAQEKAEILYQNYLKGRL